MILVDTNVLVALVDPRDGLNKRAVADAPALLKRELFVTGPVLVETFHFLQSWHVRQRLAAMLDEWSVNVAPTDDRSVWAGAWAWLETYAEHDPDWTDACLAVLCGIERRFRVWTYDREFRTTWRRPDGTRIPLAVK